MRAVRAYRLAVMRPVPQQRARYDAVVVVSFGGPEAPEEVMPFLRNVTRGRNIAPERLAAVAEHYLARGGGALSTIRTEDSWSRWRRLSRAPAWTWRSTGGTATGIPLLTDTVAAMRTDGVRRALAFVTSAFGSYSGCRQYSEDIAAARERCEDAPEIHKLRLFYNHPGFIEPMAEGVREALGRLGRRSGRHHRLRAHEPPASGLLGAQHPGGHGRRRSLRAAVAGGGSL